MPTNHASHHVHVPVFHAFDTPHLEWHEVAHPIRAALITAGVAASIGVAGLAIESASEAYARSTTPPPVTLEWEKRAIDPQWRFDRPSVDTRSMIRRGAETRSLDHIWRKR